MTPEDLPENEEGKREDNPVTTQFGLLRTLIWMSPGFGAAVMWLCLGNWRSAIYCPDFRVKCWITGAVALLCVAAFAWMDALVNPSVAKRDGHPTLRGLWISVAWFTGGQVVTMTPVFLTTVLFAEMA